MTIDEILRRKGHDVVTTAPSATVLEAARLLVHHDIGAVVVTEGGRVRGILSERDILRLSAGRSVDLASATVGLVMTRAVITASPGDELMELMDVMTERKVRHLPVMDGDRLTGIVSIGDLVNACRLLAEEENLQLRQYVQGVG